MKKIATGAVACMLVLSLPSFAAGPRNDTNDATRTMSDSVQQTPNTGGVAPEDSGAAQKESPPDAAIAGMRKSQESAKRVQSMSKVAFLRVVDVGKGGDKAAVDKAATENRDGIKALQDAIRANASVQGKLTEKSVKPESVVAVKLNDDGSLTVYIDKAALSR
jgi:hypothetical protein